MVIEATSSTLSAIRPAGVGGEVKVFGLSESQIARRVKVIARAAGLADWEFFSGHSGRVGMARRMAQNGAPTHEIERQGRWKQGGGMVGRYTRGETAGSALRYLCRRERHAVLCKDMGSIFVGVDKGYPLEITSVIA